MTPQEYLTEVSRTIATHGHRGNGSFIEAARTGSAGGATSYKNKYHVAEYVRDRIKEGLQFYVPGAAYFEPTVAVEYAALVAKFNSVS